MINFIYLLIILLFVDLINTCEFGWHRYENKCFRYIPTKVNYKSAIDLCKSQNASLASIHSKDEHLFIEEMARHYSSASGVHWVWLGGQRIKQNSTLNDFNNSSIANETRASEFKWQDGSEFNYSEWRSNCPDKRRDEDCILMSIFQSRSSHWCNYKCDTNQDHVICQRYLLSDLNNKTINNTAIKNDEQDNNMEISCDFGWTLNDKFCYKYFDTNLTWANANTLCLKNDAYLISVNSESEQIFLQNYLFQISGALEAVWLGAKRKGADKSFFWSDNSSKLEYTNYAPHEPDFRNFGENCLAMNNVDEYFGLWLDAPCGVLFAVACKKKAKLVPTCSNSEILNEAQKAIQMNDFIIQLLQRITNKLDENQMKAYKFDQKSSNSKEDKAIALEMKSEVDSILHNSSLIKLSLNLSIFISIILISLILFSLVIVFKRRHLIKKPYLSIFSFKNLNYEDKQHNEYEELLYNNQNTSTNSASRNQSDKV